MRFHFEQAVAAAIATEVNLSMVKLFARYVILLIVFSIHDVSTPCQSYDARATRE